MQKLLPARHIGVTADQSSPRPKAVLCDLDGTLLDSNALHAEAWQKTFEHFGIVADFDKVLHQIGKGGDNLLPVFVPEPERDRLAKQLEEYRKNLFQKEYLPRVAPLPCARDLLVKMKSAGIRIAIASSASKQDLEKFKEIANITDLVEEETSSDDAERSKPAPDIFQATLERLNVTPDQVLALGDTPWDVQAAGKAKIATVAVTSGGWSEHDLREAGAIEVYKDVEELTKEFDRSAFFRGVVLR